MQNYQYLILIFFCISAINCEDLVGAPISIEAEKHSEIESKLKEALTQLKGQEDGTDLCLIGISSVTQQVVAGTIYEFDAELEHCVDKTPKKCKVTIWEKLWEQFQDTKFACEDSTNYQVKDSKRMKRALKTEETTKKRTLFGGATDVEGDELAELKQNITESFVQLQSDNESNTPELKEVYGAKKQVVSGILYTVKTSIDSGNGLQRCQIEVWVKPWIQDFRKVSVNCENGENFKIEPKLRAKRSAEFRPLIEDDESIIDGFNVDSDESHFSRFKRNYGRVYQNDEEESMRFRIFQNNLYLIRQLNKFEQGSAVYGVTDFTDLTSDEYFQRTGLLQRNSGEQNEIQNPLADIPDIKLPKSHDWRDKNAVTPVKNQGNCGSCWAFSVTGNIEGLHAIKMGQLKSFSEQELVDCDDLDAGCNGGLPDNAVKFIEKEGGLEFESDYPYTAHRSKACNFNSSLSRVRVSGVVDFKKGDEEGMAKWLVANGPISIGINANAMQFYRGGISHPWKALCRASSLDHGVLIVGYGVAEYPAFNKTMPYWIIKNSWGPRWGEQGYYRVHRGDNTCGVSSMASSAVLSKSSY